MIVRCQPVDCSRRRWNPGPGPDPASSAGGQRQRPAASQPARQAKRLHSRCLACGGLRVAEVDYNELECLWNAAAVSEPESESEPGSERNLKKIRSN